MYGKKILFLGTHGQHNIGDELLLETFLAQLGNQHTYFINSYDPEFTSNQLADKYNVHVFHTTQDKWQLPRLIWQSDLLFLGGGSVIKELYKSVGRNRYATLFMLLLITTFARLIARKPIMMSNVGVGPLNTRFGHFLAGLILRQATLVSVRDQNSYNICLRLGIDKRHLFLVPDAVFVNEAACFGQIETDHPTMPSRKLKIALNLNYDIENGENWPLFLENLATTLHEIHQQQPVEIQALPMQSRFKSRDDLSVLTEFRERLDNGIDVILHEPLTPGEVGSIISQCDLVVAERLHSLVIAAILQKPFVALMYDVKVRELTEFLDMGDFAIDINRPFDHNILTRCVLTLYERRCQVAAHLEERAVEARRNLRAYFGLLTARVAQYPLVSARSGDRLQQAGGTVRRPATAHSHSTFLQVEQPE